MSIRLFEALRVRYVSVSNVGNVHVDADSPGPACAVRRIKMLRGIVCAAVALAVAPPRSPAPPPRPARRVVRGGRRFP